MVDQPAGLSDLISHEEKWPATWTVHSGKKKYVGTILHGLGKYTCECVCVFEGIFGWRDSEGREMEG